VETDRDACIHLPQTHDMVRLLRRILDLTAPGVMLVTETNVPHDENISYFGDGTDEAQMVYNFTLPPLLLYSLATGNARVFSDWAQGPGAAIGTNGLFQFYRLPRRYRGAPPGGDTAFIGDRMAGGTRS
jgi:hypothetical protein